MHLLEHELKNGVASNNTDTDDNYCANDSQNDEDNNEGGIEGKAMQSQSKEFKASIMQKQQKLAVAQRPELNKSGRNQMMNTSGNQSRDIINGA